MLIPYLMKSATISKVSYINEMGMSYSSHKINAKNILANYNPNLRNSFISKFWQFYFGETTLCRFTKCNSKQKKNAYQFVGMQVKVAFNL